MYPFTCVCPLFIISFIRVLLASGSWPSTDSQKVWASPVRSFSGWKPRHWQQKFVDQGDHVLDYIGLFHVSNFWNYFTSQPNRQRLAVTTKDKLQRQTQTHNRAAGAATHQCLLRLVLLQLQQANHNHSITQHTPVLVTPLPTPGVASLFRGLATAQWSEPQRPRFPDVVDDRMVL